MAEREIIVTKTVPVRKRHFFSEHAKSCLGLRIKLTLHVGSQKSCAGTSRQYAGGGGASAVSRLGWRRLARILRETAGGLGVRGPCECVEPLDVCAGAHRARTLRTRAASAASSPAAREPLGPQRSLAADWCQLIPLIAKLQNSISRNVGLVMFNKKQIFDIYAPKALVPPP